MDVKSIAVVASVAAMRGITVWVPWPRPKKSEIVRFPPACPAGVAADSAAARRRPPCVEARCAAAMSEAGRATRMGGIEMETQK
jgi:hypothetical protein